MLLGSSAVRMRRLARVHGRQLARCKRGRRLETAASAHELECEAHARSRRAAHTYGRGWRGASTADGLSAVRTSSSLMHTLAAVDQRACTAGGWRCAGAADGRKAEARAHKLERDAYAMRTHAIGRCATEWREETTLR